MLNKTFAFLASALGLSFLAFSKDAEASAATKGLFPSSKLSSVKMYNKYRDVIDSESKRLEIPISTAVATLIVESSGSPFGSDGKLLINFEGHVFNKKAGTSYPASFFPNGGQITEYGNFNKAKEIDEYAAYWSISMGMAQIMGFNHSIIGYSTPKDMYEDFSSSADKQVESFFKFCENNKKGILLKAARENDFATFAYYYNGPGYKTGKYDEKIKAAKAAFTKETGIV